MKLRVEPEGANLMGDSIKIIPRIEVSEHRERVPVLVFPETVDERRNCVDCYSHVGQHSCMSLDYYGGFTYSPRPGECDGLIEEYKSLLVGGVKVMQRMSSRQGIKEAT